MSTSLPLEGNEPYLSAASALIDHVGCVVTKWRSNTTGVAYTNDEDWAIEVPRPRGPKSFVVFAHEVGHQELHRTNRSGRLRYHEEIEAWEYALDTFERFNLPGRDQAQVIAAEYLTWAFIKAVRRARNTADARWRVIQREAPRWWLKNRDHVSEVASEVRTTLARYTKYHPTAWFDESQDAWIRITPSGSTVISSNPPPPRYKRYPVPTILRRS